MTERVMHRYRVVIRVTKENRKELEREHGKVLLVGDSLHLMVDGGLKPTLTLRLMYRSLGVELGGVTQYQREEITTTDWEVL